MLSKPTVDEVMKDRFRMSRFTEEFSIRQAVAFNARMKTAQHDLIRQRHMMDMDDETRLRAQMVLDGSYHGKKIPSLAL